MFCTQAYNSFTTHSLESWGQGQSRGVSEPRLGLLMEPALFRGGSVTRTINNKFSVNLGIFPENEPICQGKIWVAADS